MRRQSGLCGNGLCSVERRMSDVLRKVGVSSGSELMPLLSMQVKETKLLT